jgi:PAS domain S-box-containing protein
MRLRDGLMLDLNDEWTAQTGYDKSERIGKTVDEFNIYADRRTRERLIESLLKSGEITNYEGEYRVKDGSIRHGLTSARVIELDGEQCVVAISRDITAHKAAQEAIRLSETKFRTLAETTPSAIVVYRLDDNRIQYVNAAMEKISGYSEAELLKLTVPDLIHPDSLEFVKERRRARLRGEYVSPRVELKLITKDGEERWVDQSLGTIEFEGQSAIIVTAFDITDRKRAEEALRRSEERYRLIVENQTEFIVKWLPDGRRTFVNDSYCRYFGISEADCIGTSFFPLIAPEFHEGIRTKIRSLKPDASEYTEEHQSLVAGELRWQQWTNRGIMDPDGNLVELLSSGRDITDRKNAEQALQESEARGRLLNERFSLAVESAGIGVWDLDLVNNELTLDQQMNRLYRVDPEEFSGAYEAWASRVHPDDLPRVNEEVLQAIKGLKRFATNFRVVWPNGEARHIRAFARVLNDDNGRPVRMTGINYDITDRMRAEKALIQSEAHYRALVENTPDIIARFDSDCRYLFVNSAVSQISSIKPEDFVGKSLRDVGFSEKQASFREGVLRKVFRTQTPFETEFLFEGQNGGRVYEWRVYPEFDEQGRMQTVLSINRDMTERRMAEEGLKQSREQLRALSSHLQSIREEERTRIAREVHDVLGQALTALKIDLYGVQRGLSRETDLGAEHLAEKMKSMSSLIDSTIQTVRRIATELRPGILDDLGLVAAVEWQANDFQVRTGIDCEVTSHVDYLDLDRERSTATFRILQETLTNVARHAAASRVEITLTSDDERLVLEIKDNGKGITDSDVADSRSLGLLGMRERAQLLGGDLSISGTPGHGTLVTVTIPLVIGAAASGLVE